MDHLIQKVKSTPIGDGFDDAVTSGPIVSEWVAGIRSAKHGGLTQEFGRSQKPNMIRCGVISNLVDRKVPKYWLVERNVRARGIL
jgi:hypothetical protein